MTPKTASAPLPAPSTASRQRKAVGVVGQPHFPLQQCLQVALQRLADEAGGVRVLDQAALRGFDTGRADADAAAAAEFVFQRLDQSGHRHQGRHVVTGRGRDAPAGEHLPAIEGSRLDLGAAEIDADAHAGQAPSSEASACS